MSWLASPSEHGNMQKRAHPANVLLKQSRDQLMKALRQLNVIEVPEMSDLLKDFG